MFFARREIVTNSSRVLVCTSLASPDALVSAPSVCRAADGAEDRLLLLRAKVPLGQARNKMSPVKRETFENK